MPLPIPVSTSDIIKLLEGIPLWKSLIGLPKRLAELEARVKTLEGGQQSKIGARPNECPYCGAVMALVNEAPHPEFEFAGLKVHTFSCDGCGKSVSRDWSPKKGYQ